jgi:hypothetical protein
VSEYLLKISLIIMHCVRTRRGTLEAGIVTLEIKHQGLIETGPHKLPVDIRGDDEVALPLNQSIQVLIHAAKWRHIANPLDD